MTPSVDWGYEPGRERTAVSTPAVGAEIAPTLRRAVGGFATRVVEYRPGPGQFSASGMFNNPARALGAPVTGTPDAPDNSKVVSLGRLGGSITLGFDGAVADLPPTASNPHGLDAIVFGNAFYVGGDPERWWAEAGVIEIARDIDGDGSPDGGWYVIAAPGRPRPRAVTRVYRRADFPAAQWPAWAAGLEEFQLSGYVAERVSGGPPIQVSDPIPAGLADATPMVLLGDTDADGLVDWPGVAPEMFYGRPADPFSVDPVRRWRGGGGGDGFAIEWAIDPVTGLAPSPRLGGFELIRVSTAAEGSVGLFGEVSTEVGGVSRVVAGPSADVADALGRPWPDGVVDAADLVAFVTAFAQGDVRIADTADGSGRTAGDGGGPDGFLDAVDMVVFLTVFVEGGAL